MSSNPSVSSNSAGWTTVRGPQHHIPTIQFPSHAANAFSKSKPTKSTQVHFSETAAQAFSRPKSSNVSHNNVGFSDSASAAFGAGKQTKYDDMPSAFTHGGGNRRDDEFDTQAASVFGKKRIHKGMSSMSDSSRTPIVETRNNMFSNMIQAALPSTSSNVTPVDYNKSALRKAEPTQEDMFPALVST